MEQVFAILMMFSGPSQCGTEVICWKPYNEARFSTEAKCRVAEKLEREHLHHIKQDRQLRCGPAETPP